MSRRNSCAAREVPTLVAVTKNADEKSLALLEAAGCEILKLPMDLEGNPDMAQLLDELGRRRWTNLLVEGGAVIFGSLFDCNFVDEIHVFYATGKLFGSGKNAVMGRGLDAVVGGGRWRADAIEIVEGDIYVHCVRD